MDMIREKFGAPYRDTPTDPFSSSYEPLGSLNSSLAPEPDHGLTDRTFGATHFNAAQLTLGLPRESAERLQKGVGLSVISAFGHAELLKVARLL